MANAGFLALATEYRLAPPGGLTLLLTRADATRLRLPAEGLVTRGPVALEATATDNRALSSFVWEATPTIPVTAISNVRWWSGAAYFATSSLRPPIRCRDGRN